MNWQDFIMGGMTVIISFVFYSMGREDEVVDEIDPDEGESNIFVNNFAGRHITLSCQTCRKLKRHKEVQPNLFQCVKCKRHVDLRAS